MHIHKNLTEKLIEFDLITGEANSLHFRAR